MEFLTAIEQLALVRALKISFFAYPLVNALHIAAIGTLFSSVLLMDLRVLGAFHTVESASFIALMRRVAVTAFVIAVLSGLTLFSVRAADYALMPIFLAKMGLILLAGANFLLFLRLDRSAARWGPDRTALRVSSVVSILLWTCALVAGRFIGFV